MLRAQPLGSTAPKLPAVLFVAGAKDKAFFMPMLNLKTICLVVLFLVCGKSAIAQTSVDWKLYGSAAVREDQEFCFYESLGAATTPQGYVRVWAKCLPQKDWSAPHFDRTRALARRA